ncbi:hypothetical protein GQ600_8841 [Phytophthora cactorum]|nr:hypothetical protein GQ600_8841 [Phytophthora cactorum]
MEDYQKILTNADVAIGIRVQKVDTFTKHQLEVMTEYHEVMKQLLDVLETIEWVQTTSLNSLNMPQGLDEYANLEKATATTAIQRLVFPMSRISPFEEITNEALLVFRQDLWINDDCIMHAMTSLQQEFKLPIEIISPTFMGTKSAASRTVIVQKRSPSTTAPTSCSY